MTLKTCALILTAAFVSAAASVAHGMVYDGGRFASDKVTTHTDLGSDGPEPVPTNLAYDLDRYSNAPVGVPLYVLGTDDRCYRGNFSYSKYEKVLIIYSKSPVSSQYCIYQRNYSTNPLGFAISARDGGVCVPAFAGLKGDKMGIEEKGGAVAFSDCIAGTVSFGDYVDHIHGTSDRKVASSGGQDASKLESGTLPQWVTTATEVHTPQIATPISVSRASKKIVSDIVKGNYTFQVSSHSSLEEAEAKIKALKGLGLEAFMMTAKVRGSTWFRVCTGHFDTWKKAKSAWSSMVEKTGLKDLFIQKINKPDSSKSQE